MTRRLLIFFLGSGFGALAPGADRPNILWLTSEDNSPYLGCYGDPLAVTPHLDEFAEGAIRYRNAFSGAPVCSAARSTLITGMNACTLGLQNHRSSVAVPDTVVYYPQVFREAGYYCTNNSKTDYNMALGGKRAGAEAVGWHESSNKAHYRNRADGQPFFAVFNTTLSHEGQTTDKAYAGRRKVNPPQRIVPPEKVVLPPYHPDTPVIRENWSRYYDNLWLMDKWVGEKLAELAMSGEAENTIVFYYGDHGGALPRGKRNIHDSGTRVPLIIRIPEKWQHLAQAKPGAWVEDPVAFVDFPATAAHLCGLEVPEIWEGRPFLGPKAVKRDYVFLFRGRMDERYDTVRAIRTKDTLYVKNFSPQRPWGQAYTYPFEVMASMGSWYAEFRAGRCNAVQARYWQEKPGEEFYLVADDPFQVANLIEEAAQRLHIEQARLRMKEEMVKSRDTGLIPEGMVPRLAGEATIYEYAQSKRYPAEKVLAAALLATSRDAEQVEELVALCEAESPLLRYWGASGALVLGGKAAAMKPQLTALLTDSVPDVRVAAAEALGHLGGLDAVTPVLVEVIKTGNEHEGLAAITALEAFGRDGLLPMDDVVALLPKKVKGDATRVVDAIEKIP